MLRLVAISCLISIAATANAFFPQEPTKEEIKQLIEKLGSPEFTEREESTKRLAEIGAPALDALREACKSENPETARRAQEVLRKLEQKLANEKMLAPTLVELDERDAALDVLLAALSKQGKCEVVLGGLKPEELAQQKVTVSTNGKVPLWTAVLKVCEAADLQIAVVGGFMAPGAMPYLGRPKGKLRVATNPNQSIVLEAREPKTPRRPAAVQGAVLIETLPYPKNMVVVDSPTVLIQAWPEPHLQWQATTTVKIVKAIDTNGVRLAAEYLPPRGARAPMITREGIILIRNADGSVTVIRDVSPGSQSGGLFSPNTRQAVLNFKHTDKQTEIVKQLDLSFYASVRTGIEPICQARGLLQNQNAKGASGSDVEMSVRYEKDPNDKLVAEVSLNYDTKNVQPVGIVDELPGIKGTTNLGYGNHTVNGILITDKDGKPFGLGLRSGSNQLEGNGNRITRKMTLELVPDRDSNSPPTTITFWGTHSRQVEIPISLKDVPLTVTK
jgi:hypothetical protein